MTIVTVHFIPFGVILIIPFLLPLPLRFPVKSLSGVVGNWHVWSMVTMGYEQEARHPDNVYCFSAFYGLR